PERDTETHRRSVVPASQRIAPHETLGPAATANRDTRPRRSQAGTPRAPRQNTAVAIRPPTGPPPYTDRGASSPIRAGGVSCRLAGGHRRRPALHLPRSRGGPIERAHPGGR